MSRQTRAIVADLKPLVRGELLFDDTNRVLYSTDASLFEMRPLGVVRPVDAEDVSNVVRFCHRHRIPITARGAGSSVAGQSVGRGIVLDMSRFMDRVVEVGEDFVRVQPGVVLAELNRGLGGMFFPPDPASAEFCTIGGMINTNAGGMHSLKYGTTRDYVLELDVIRDSGERMLIRDAQPVAIYRELTQLFENHVDVIQRARPASPKNSSGYHVYDRPVHLPRLVCGSEGTLCVVVEARLRTRPVPKHRKLVLLGFESTREACARVTELAAMGPSALELMDDTALEFVLAYRPELKALLPDPAGAVLFCEFEEGIPELGSHARILTETEAAAAWKVRKSISPALERVKGDERSTRVVEDACVEPTKVFDYVDGLKRILEAHRVRAAIFGHAGSGNIHCNVFLSPRDTKTMKAIAEQVTELVLRLRGTLSGEHGDGLLRAPYLRRFFGDLYPIFERVKELFDPTGILNPGKKLCRPRYSFLSDLRESRSAAFAVDPRFPLLDVLEESVRCNGCNKCRTYCPLYSEEREEFSTPRAKNNLLVAAAQGDVALPSDSRFKAHLTRCLECGKCVTDCPAGCDLPAVAKAVIRQ